MTGYDDANDADRLSLDPAMRAIVDPKGFDRVAASTNQMGRFEAQWLLSEDNLEALIELSGAWIQRVHEHKPPKMIVLDMDSSESPTYGASATQFAQPASRVLVTAIHGFNYFDGSMDARVSRSDLIRRPGMTKCMGESSDVRFFPLCRKLNRTAWPPMDAVITTPFPYPAGRDVVHRDLRASCAPAGTMRSSSASSAMPACNRPAVRRKVDLPRRAAYI